MTSIANPGSSHASRSLNQHSSYIPNSGLSGNNGGGTYTSNHNEPSVEDFKNVFGPVAENIKDDLQRYKRHGRWHLPDILKGPNPWLADRIDGLITDATSSPFTSTILPYKYFDNVDGKIKWNVWSFDEAMPSRVPYEAAARTLTQTKRSFSGYAVRHGLAITLEHNFMMTPTGRENFQNQLNQLVGSIQYANDLDVHMALIMAPSYEKTMLEKYNNNNKSATQICREYVDLFGFMQKNQNGMDILIEEAKQKLKTWGGPVPNFMLTNSKLTFQLTMTPERTNYMTQGIDGVKRLRQGPDIASYRGVNIIPTRSFSMETGQPPRDVLRRRVRVAEYYRILPSIENIHNTYEFFNEDRDNFFQMTFMDLLKAAYVPEETHKIDSNTNDENLEYFAFLMHEIQKLMHPQDLAQQGQVWAASKMENPKSDKWNNLFSTLQTDSDYTVKISPEHLTASFVQDSQIFVPFASNLHIENSASYTNWTSGVSSGIHNYPFTQQEPQPYPAALTNPTTHQEVQRGTPEYNETRILHARMHNRYATPTTFLKIEDGELVLDKSSLKQQYLTVSDMFYQPLGAFNEPNHPLFHEQMPPSMSKDVHTGWILTEDILNLILKDPKNCHKIAEIAASVESKGLSRAAYSVKIANDIASCMEMPSKTDKTAQAHAFYTWTVTDNYLLSNDYLNPRSELGKKYHTELKKYAPNGLVTTEYLQKLTEMSNATDHPWMQPVHVSGKASPASVMKTLKARVLADPYACYKNNLQEGAAFERFATQLLKIDMTPTRVHTEGFNRVIPAKTGIFNEESIKKHARLHSKKAVPTAHENDHDNWLRMLQMTEIVIIRPNIEHYMMGIILGLSGESTGNTLWGQTELSVYDDSQHGVWGMSYKYHERAIVFNEKNLIRLWDIAYDGYNGGKDDTYVDWSNEADINKFKEHTNDLTRDYHGQSMMVMAFVHDNPAMIKRNWPSPINFFDNNTANTITGAENQSIISTRDFNVFTRELYPAYYHVYKPLMPDFADLHQMRKNASESSKDDETQVNNLAFQGTMRIKKNGCVIDTINGSGHHGVDYVGVASVRAGKGYKMANGITNVVRNV